MNKLQLLTITGLALSLYAATAADEKPAFKDPRDRLSYSIGMSIGGSLKMQEADVNVEVLCKAIKDSLATTNTALTQDEMRETLKTWQMEMRTKRMEQQKVQGDKNKKEGEAFLAANAKKEGVTVLPDGLQYKVLTAGTGKAPASNDTVKVHYKGTLTDGTEFDSSYTRGQPMVTPVTRLIPGWTEALLKMHVGDKWQLFVPANLAYGERGMPPKIGPGAVLIFEMELLGLEDPKPQPAGMTIPSTTPTPLPKPPIVDKK